MSKTTICFVALTVGIIAVLLLPLDAAPVYIGYNATLCQSRNVTFAVRGNCSAFYICQNNHVWRDRCNSTMLYNSTNGRCAAANSVRCNNATGILLPGPQRGLNKQVAASNTTSIYVGYNATLCRGNGTHPVKTRCQSYYLCQNNYVYQYDCTYPLLYNMFNKYCDYAWNVNCNRTMLGHKSAESNQPILNFGEAPSRLTKDSFLAVDPVYRKRY